MQIFADTGSNKLENKYADFTVSPLHFLQSSFSAVQLAEVIYTLSLIGAFFFVDFTPFFYCH